MPIQLVTHSAGRIPRPIVQYVQGVNAHDSAAVVAAFTEDALIDDVQREIRGIGAIRKWIEQEITDARTTMQVISVAAHQDEPIVTARFDSEFDMSGLLAPHIVTSRFSLAGDRILRLEIRADHPVL